RRRHTAARHTAGHTRLAGRDQRGRHRIVPGQRRGPAHAYCAGVDAHAPAEYRRFGQPLTGAARRESVAVVERIEAPLGFADAGSEAYAEVARLDRLDDRVRAARGVDFDPRPTEMRIAV